MRAFELTAGRLLKSGDTVVSTVRHETFTAVIVKHMNGVVSIRNFDHTYDVANAIDGAAELQRAIDKLGGVAVRPRHPETGHACADCRRRDDFLEDVAERRAEEARIH